jgi:2-keto-3-deoxy-galactonokinase
MNSIKEKMENFRNGKEELEEYLQQEREKNRYDPRPDLSDDTELWQAVLEEAKKQDRQVYSNLHGFRCVGCRLQLENEQLKLLPGAAIGQHWKNKKEWKQDRREYLIPFKDTISAVFKAVYQELMSNEGITKNTV